MKVRMTPRATFIVVLQVSSNEYGSLTKPHSFRVSLRNSPMLHKELDSYIEHKIREVSYGFVKYLRSGVVIRPEVSIASVVKL